MKFGGGGGEEEEWGGWRGKGLWIVIIELFAAGKMQQRAERRRGRSGSESWLADSWQGFVITPDYWTKNIERVKGPLWGRNKKGQNPIVS